MRTHVFLPDTQVRKGVPTDHIAWCAEYIASRKPDVIVVAGDWWDMPSLSSHDAPGSMKLEGARYEDDVEAGNKAFDTFAKPLKRLKCEKHFLSGNHENRIRRAVEAVPKLAGTIGDHHLNAGRHGFTCHPFLRVVDLDGVWYSHYFYRPLSGRPYSGQIGSRLANVGNSFSQGHEQTFLYGTRNLANGREQHGLIAGACYLHDEDYKGPQGNHHFRGLVVKHEVHDGRYDLMRVSLDYLCRKYEGVPLRTFLRKKYPRMPLSLAA